MRIEWAGAPLRGASPLVAYTPGPSVRFAHVDGLGLIHDFVFDEVLVVCVLRKIGNCVGVGEDDCFSD